MSTSQTRRMKRFVTRSILRESRKRAKNVAKLRYWINRHPRDPLAIELKAMKAGLQVVTAEEMAEGIKKQVIRENITPSGLVLPPGVEVKDG